MQKNNNTHWGVTQLQGAQSLPQGLTLIERSSANFKRPKAGLQQILNAGFWHINAPDGDGEAEHHERVSVLIETCGELDPAACIISLPPSVTEKVATARRAQALLKIIQTQGLCPTYFDFGKLAPPAWINPNACVSDPLWHSGAVFGDLWKIHGWHPNRWVRLYAPSELKELKRLASLHRPRFVILGHSQRLKQWRELRSI